VQQEEGCGAIDSLLETSSEEFSGNWCGYTTGRFLSQQMSLLVFERVLKSSERCSAAETRCSTRSNNEWLTETK